MNSLKICFTLIIIVVLYNKETKTAASDETDEETDEDEFDVQSFLLELSLNSSARLDALEATVSSISEQTSSISAQLEDIEVELSTISNETSSLAVELEESVSIITSNLSILTMRVDTVETTSSSNSERLDAIDVILANLNASIQDLAATLDDVLAESCGGEAMFYAGINLPGDDALLSTTGIIVYQDVLINVGDGYDSSTGIFTAPTNGTYIFFVKTLGNHNPRVVILKDGVYLGRYNGVDSSDYSSEMMPLMIHLVEGEQVYTELHIGTLVGFNPTFFSPAHPSVFTGYLLAKDC